MKVRTKTTLRVATKPGRVTKDLPYGSPPETETVPPGTIVDLPDEEAQSLLARGLVVDPSGAAPAKAGAVPQDRQPDPSSPGDSGEPDAGAQRREEILIAMMALAEEREADSEGTAERFTAAGLPRVEVLSERLGYEVTAEERDALWPEAIA